MDQFVVPQFIDVEDKIIGPITVRQFIMIMAAGLLIFIEFRFFDFVLFVVLALATLSALILLAFLKVNGRPSYYFLLNFIQTLKRPRLRVWHKVPEKAGNMFSAVSLLKKGERDQAGAEHGQPGQGPGHPVSAKARPTVSQLAQLALLVDTGGMYGVEGKREEDLYG